MTKTLLAVDGNSLVHRSFHAKAGTNLRAADGRPTWAVDGFLYQLLGALEKVGADAVVVGFDDHTHSERKARWPHYKATRSPKPPELGQQIAMTAQLLREAGVPVVVPAGLEADDVLASAARHAAGAGWRTVIVTSDRDSFALIDATTSVLRLITGGVEGSPILTPDRLHLLTDGVLPHQYREFAALRGDTSDNLAGVSGFGKVRAAKLLATFATVQEAFDDVDADGGRVRALLGPAAAAKLADPVNREAFALNVAIMTMRDDLPLDGLDLTAGVGALPLDPDRVVAALTRLSLARVQPLALRLLSRPPAAAPVAPTEPDLGAYPPALDEFVPPLADEPAASSPARPRPLVSAAATAAAMPGSSAARPGIWEDTLF